MDGVFVWGWDFLVIVCFEKMKFVEGCVGLGVGFFFYVWEGRFCDLFLCVGFGVGSFLFKRFGVRVYLNRRKLRFWE